MKRILLDNAYEAWGQAIKYCDEILAGKITFQNKKFFVSALHNAVELFLKQCMIDKNIHSIVDIPRTSKINARRFDDTLSVFRKSENLNQYFSDLDIKKLEQFHFISFYKLIYKKNLKEILAEYFTPYDVFGNKRNFISVNDIYKALCLLNKLRNKETHFYIDNDTFLSSKDFITLHNFMLSFYDILQECMLLPYWGTPQKDMDDFRFHFKSKPLQDNWTYYEHIKSLSVFNIIINMVNNNDTDFFRYSAYEIAEMIETENISELSSLHFEDLYNYSLVLMQMGVIVRKHESFVNADGIQQEFDYMSASWNNVTIQ